MCTLLQIRDALKEFEDTVGHPFQMYHCWLILRHQRKWNDQTSAKPTATPSVDNNGSDPVQDNNNPLNCPIGRDAAKKKEARGIWHHLPLPLVWRSCRNCQPQERSWN